jgi:hypothetical protein|eukprot:COSAG02_NODE_2144_length_9681_cov_209.373304_7_plen_54_part_00
MLHRKKSLSIQKITTLARGKQQPTTQQETAASAIVFAPTAATPHMLRAYIRHA